MKTQIGLAVGADFLENEWTFEMEDDFSVTAGKFAIVPLEHYNDVIQKLEHLAEAFPNYADIQYMKDDIKSCINKL